MVVSNIISSKAIVSIVIPSYNRSQILLQSLERVNCLLNYCELFRSFFSIIILDNASEDLEGYKNIANTCKKYGFSYFRSPSNTGAYSNFCRAYACSSTSPYLWILSDDEILQDFSLRVIHALLSKNSGRPALIGFNTLHTGIPFIGSCKEWISQAIKINFSLITSLTLVSSIIFDRKLFSLETFWCYEAHWFPHSYAVFGSAISFDVKICIIQSTCYITESGNTAIERAANKESTEILMLNRQFQTACLQFLNYCIKLAGHEPLSQHEYVDKISNDFSIHPDYIWKGMQPISSFHIVNR